MQYEPDVGCWTDSEKQYGEIPRTGDCEDYAILLVALHRFQTQGGISAVVGPHPLDDAWGIVDPWVGLGFGLEKLVMVRQEYQNIQRVGRSLIYLIYLDGIRLNI